MATSLENILDGEEVVEEKTETPEPEKAEVVEEETQETAEESVEETEVEEPKVEKEAEPTAAEDVKTVPLAAVLDERDKRKELQRQIEQLTAEREKETQEKVDFWENPEEAVAAKIESVVGDLRQNQQRDFLALSMQYSKAFHDDFDEAKDAFAKAAEENRALADMALQSEMPGEYIYETGKQFMQLDAVGGDVNALRDQIRREEREKILKELKDKQQTLDEVPDSLTDETSATAPRQKAEGGPTPLESILTTNR